NLAQPPQGFPGRKWEPEGGAIALEGHGSVELQNLTEDDQPAICPIDSFETPCYFSCVGGCLFVRDTMLTDWQLLDQYAAKASEDAFRTLVERHSGLVFHTAFRQLGNAHAAEEVTQAVFIALARKAGKIPRNAVLSGWLFRATRYAVSNLAREEVRRQRREQESYMADTISRYATESVWAQMSPHLNEALDKLPAREREALLIRFFEEKSHKEIAGALGISEDAAKMRVSRGIEKLRLVFARQGFVVPS